VARNVIAAKLSAFGAWWFRDTFGNNLAEDYRRKLRIATPSVSQPVQNLSGGNQQKVVLSRWLLVNPRILIVDEPTRGIDVGTKAEVHNLLRELAAQGTAVILISSDLPEVLSVAHRVLVMREGIITAELVGDQATEEQVVKFASMTVQE
jgi:ABC-type sugar transport system ATPase subunit